MLMRAVKWAAYVIGALIGLIVLVLLGVLLFVDPNKYRGDIERIVEQKTGRDLTLSGDLKLSVFPWIALETGAVSLGDAPGFGPEPFLALKQARVGVRLLPLLRGRVEISTVKLDGVRVRLITDAQGRHNWADLGAKSSSEESASTSSSVIPTIAGVEVDDAAITMEDRQAKTRRVIRDVKLKTGRFVSGEPFALTFACVLDQEPASSIRITLQSKVTADLAQSHYRLDAPTIALVLTGQGYPEKGIPIDVRAQSAVADTKNELYQLEAFRLDAKWAGQGLPAEGVPIALASSNLQANLQQQTLEIPDLDLKIAGAHLTGRLKGEDILDAPNIKGPLKLDPLSLREWLPKVGMTVPQTRDAQVLKTVSFSSNVAVTKTSAELSNVELKLDDTTAKGMVGIADFAAKALRFDLTIDRIDADRYLPPQEAGTTKAADEAPTPIPVDALRTLNARGQLVVQHAIFAGMTFTNLRLGVSARDGKIRFNPSEASLYGGQYHGDIGIDATGSTARVSLDEHISGVDFAPLFKDLFKTNRVAGKGSANVVVNGTGRTTDEVMKTLGGNVDFKVVDGALEGADLWYEIRRARALLRQQAIPERSGPARTPFNALTATGVMKNGVLTTDDLNIAMQYLKVTGQGSVDVPASTLDYRLTASVLKIPREGAEADAQDLVDAQIPVRITGSLSDPKVRPDLEGYLKNEVKQRVEQERGKVEQKVKDKLGDKLKDLLGR
jgi:AsmA protein